MLPTHVFSLPMPTAHRPNSDGWESDDINQFDSVWRIDFSVHFFCNGMVSCTVLPICTVEGDEACVSALYRRPTSIEALLTVVITSSPVRSNPSTRMLLECLASLDTNGGLSRCRKLIMCDGFKVRHRSQRKLGIVTDDEAILYGEYVRAIACMCREHSALRRTRVVRLARRQGSAFAIREAVEGHVHTPFVIIVPHDCIIARRVRLDCVAAMMQASAGRVNYVKIASPSTSNYADAVCARSDDL